MAKIIYLSVKKDVPPTGYWDHTFLQEMLAELPDSDRTVVVIPGAYQGDVIPQINEELAKYPKVCVFVTSDEENKFQVGALRHPNMVVYSQYGNGGRMWPLGYVPQTREILKNIGLPLKKDLKWFFSGQITHYRRKALASVLKERGDGLLIETDGFAKGLERKEYLEHMSQAIVAPCGPGPLSVDSFRLYEALEAGCIPVADDTSPIRSAPDQYWYQLFGGVPFPVFNQAEHINIFIDRCLESPDLANQVMAWWINKKYQIKDQLAADLGLPAADMAVIMPVSPIPSHPDTSIIEETIRTVRVHTDAPIFITIDGVRDEQKDMTESYREFVRRLVWKCNFEFKDVLPVIFDKHYHQSGMMKAVVRQIKVPYLLYVEADTPLTPDWPIPLEDLKKRIASGESNVIRFHFEAFVPEPHRHLMVGEPEGDLLKTLQWSQRPHLASMEYYRTIMGEHFSKESNTFIEDKMHSVVQTHPWEDNKVHIYHPEGQIKRSYHLDGRQGAEKFDDKLIF